MTKSSGPPRKLGNPSAVATTAVVCRPLRIPLIRKGAELNERSKATRGSGRPAGGQVALGHELKLDVTSAVAGIEDHV